MTRAIRMNTSSGKHGGYAIYCPGCKHHHLFDSRWTFNGNFESPTFTPSMLVNKDNPKSRCHSFVTDGRIQFLNDCHHELAGKTVELEDADEY